MANQNIGTPRFYISYGDYWKSIGSAVPKWQTINLYSTVEITVNGSYSFMSEAATLPSPSAVNGINWFAVLNHNVSPAFYFRCKHFATDTQQDIGLGGWDTLINITDATPYPIHSGFSLGTWNTPWTNSETETLEVGLQGAGSGTFNVGCWVYGAYYDMPHSPELSLTMSHEYDGVKKQETAGGSTLSYVNYHKPPDWGDLQAWQLDGWDRKYSGRRVWDLVFNYLSDSDLEPYHYNIDSISGHANWNEDGNWFTNVLYHTNGGQLPFIFCPDPNVDFASATNTIPEFAICRFDMNTFKREQVANGVYNIKIKIKETW